MGPVDRSSVTLRVFGNPLDAGEITRLLGAEPTTAKSSGEPLPSGFVPRHGMWRLESTGDASQALDQQIFALLGLLTDDLSVWRDLANRFMIDLFGGVFMAQWNEGMTLEPATMSLMAERRLKLELDIYGPDSARTFG